MLSQSNEKTVRAIYDSFGRGDIAAIMNVLDKNVDWFVSGAPLIPYAGHYRSSEEVMKFFFKLSESVEVELFSPTRFLSEDDTVVVFGKERMKSRATRRVYEDEWVQIWNLKGDKVVSFKEFFDTDVVARAFA